MPHLNDVDPDLDLLYKYYVYEFNIVFLADVYLHEFFHFYQYLHYHDN